MLYAADLKTDRMDAVVLQIDNAAGAGYIEIGTTGMAILLATIPFDVTCGTVTTDTLTFSSFPKEDASADNSGTAAEARIRDGDASDVITGLTVGLSSADIILDSLDITAGQTVKLNSASIQHGA